MPSKEKEPEVKFTIRYGDFYPFRPKKSLVIINAEITKGTDGQNTNGK